MAVRKTGSRPITVDGVVYRWRIARRPSDEEFGWAEPMTASVGLATGRGRVLFVRCGLRHGNIRDQPGAVVTPRRIAAAIRAALAKGWEPAGKGPPLVIDLPASPEPEES
ncbi:MAG: hypothetical protein K2X87_29335 [Gemmataceae bacterium]|nr:hypothetical protein [Gemmataceae bacterium]